MGLLACIAVRVTPPAPAQDVLKAQAWLASKNVEINFFGKVVDQNDKPLSGVAVQAHTREWYMKNLFEEAGKYTNPVTVTGQDGLFSFIRLRGDAFDIRSMTKEGYILTTKTRRGYLYGPLAHHYLPNPLFPVVFHMWKTNGAVALFEVRLSLRLPQDGTPVAIDLRRNKRVTLPTEFTDLRVTLNQHAPPGQRNARTPFDWNFVLEVPDGGLVETQDEFTYLAPEQGYQPKWAVEYLKDQPNWKVRREVDFYLNNRAGQQYGRLSITFEPEAGYPSGYLVIGGYLNPAGRVLEYDSQRKLYPPPAGAPDGAMLQPAPQFRPFGAPVLGNPQPPGAPAFPLPPPGFQALTNRGKPFAPPVPSRPQ